MRSPRKQDQGLDIPPSRLLAVLATACLLLVGLPVNLTAGILMAVSRLAWMHVRLFLHIPELAVDLVTGQYKGPEKYIGPFLP